MLTVVSMKARNSIDVFFIVDIGLIGYSFLVGDTTVGFASLNSLAFSIIFLR